MKKKRNILLFLMLAALASILFLLPHSSAIEKDKIVGTEIENLLKETKTSFVLIGNRSCSSCREFKPTLEKVLNDTGKNVYYIDTNNTKNEGFLKEQNIRVTPTLLMIKNGEVKRVEGSLDYKDTKDFFLERYQF